MRSQRQILKGRKKKSARSEKRGAESLGGKITPNSGAKPGWFADFYTEDLLIEDKYRTGQFYLTSKDWGKLCRGAETKGSKIPVFRITVEDCDPVAILDPSDWEELGGTAPKTIIPWIGKTSIRVDAQLVQRLHEIGTQVTLDTPLGYLILTEWSEFARVYKEDQ